jgi:hypothetical protein
MLLRHVQSNDDFVALVQSFAKQYCDLEEASDSETVSEKAFAVPLMHGMSCLLMPGPCQLREERRRSPSQLLLLLPAFPSL